MEDPKKWMANNGNSVFMWNAEIGIPPLEVSPPELGTALFSQFPKLSEVVYPWSARLNQEIFEGSCSITFPARSHPPFWFAGHSPDSSCWGADSAVNRSSHGRWYISAVGAVECWRAELGIDANNLTSRSRMMNRNQSQIVSIKTLIRAPLNRSPEMKKDTWHYMAIIFCLCWYIPCKIITPEFTGPSAAANLSSLPLFIPLKR